MSDYAAVARVLGIKDAARLTPIRVAESVATGLPTGSVVRLAELVRPEDRNFRHQIVSRATAARSKSGRLPKAASERVARIARVWAEAVEVWSDDAEARAFLFRPHPMLEDATPIAVALESEIGADLVVNILGRLRYGSAA